MEHVRRTQRIPKRCTECARRKVKCTQTIPCQPCIARKVAHLCMREVVRIDGRLKVAVDDGHTRCAEDNDINLIQENSLLQERIAQLELALALRHDIRSRPANDGIPADVNEQISEVQTSRRARLDRVEHFASIFEEWSMGKRGHADENPTITTSSLTPFSGNLPSRGTSNKVIEFSLELGWIHCALNVPQFQEEYAAFSETIGQDGPWPLPRHSWMALYYSLLAVGFFFADPLHIPADEPTHDHIAMSQYWYKAALKELELSDILGVPDLRNVQTIAILTLCNGNFGEIEREFILVGVAISTARCIGMHRLGSEATYNHSSSNRIEWSTRAGRELGRRLWWSLVIYDWLGDLTRPASISPSSFDSVLSTGEHDADILPSYETSKHSVTPSPLENHIAMAKLSYICYVYIKADRAYSLGNIRKAIREVENLEKIQLPTYLSSHSLGTAERQAWDQQYRWLSWQRYQLRIAIQFTTLNLCRLASARSLEFVREDNFEERAITAALNIIKTRDKVVPRMFEKSWSVSAATLAAGIFLGLNLLSGERHTESVIEERQGQIISCLGNLRKLEGSTGIARQGQSILDRLLQLHRRGVESSDDKEKNMQNIVDYVCNPSFEGTHGQGHAVSINESFGNGRTGQDQFMGSTGPTSFPVNEDFVSDFPFFVESADFMLPEEPHVEMEIDWDVGYAFDFFPSITQ